MSLPALSDWTSTRVGLHQAAQVVGALRKVTAEPEPNWLHLALRVASQGLTTGSIPPVGELVLDFSGVRIDYYPLGQQLPGEIPLSGHTQTSLADTLIRLLAQAGHTVSPDRAKIGATDALDIDPDLSADYRQILQAVSGALERFRASLPGEKSAIVVWPHGFDMSFLWFATDKAEESAPHMAFGFSPYSAGFERPYVYSYAYPIPDGLTDTPLPPKARWHTQGWTGTVMDYDDFRGDPDPAATVETSLRAIFDAVAPRMSKESAHS